jgi:hypothetical protein
LLTKINISAILSDHFHTLIHEGVWKKTEVVKVRPADVVLFFVVPLPIAALGIWLAGPLDDAGITVGATVFSLLGGLLLNLLLLVYQLLNGRLKAKSDQHRLMTQTSYNISFLILVAVVVLASLLVASVATNCAVRYALSSAVYYLSGVFLLTLLMVLKRIHALLDISANAERSGGAPG